MPTKRTQDTHQDAFVVVGVVTFRNLEVDFDRDGLGRIEQVAAVDPIQ